MLTITYILKIGDRYKVGKTTNYNQRLTEYKQYHKTDIIPIMTQIGDIETFILQKFKAKQIEGEWFDLDMKDLVELRRSLTPI